MRWLLSACRRVSQWFILLGCLLVLAGCEEEAILELAWSPDGRWLAYVRGEGVYIAPVTPARALKADLLVGTVPEPHFSWSPSSRELLFTSTAEGGWNIWQAHLTEDGRWQPSQVTSHPAKDWGAVFVPDGRRFVYLSYRGGQCDIWLRQSAEGPSRPLTDDQAEESALGFGVDRALLYYLRTTEGGVAQLRAVDLNSGFHGVVAEGLREVSEVAVSPGRQRVAVVSGGELLVYSLAPGSGRGFRRAVRARSWSRLGAARDVAWSFGGDLVVFVDGTGRVRGYAFEAGRPSWDGKFAGTLPRLAPKDRCLAWVVEPGPASGGVPGLALLGEPRWQPEPQAPRLILLGQLPVEQYQCVYAEEPTLLAAAREMAALGDFEGEAELLGAILKARPAQQSDANAHSAYAFALAKVGRTREAMEWADRQLKDSLAAGVLALAYAEDSGDALKGLGQSQDPWAVEMARLLEELDGADRERLREAVRRRLEGRHREALASYQRLLRRSLSSPGRSLLVWEVAGLQKELGRREEALASFRWLTRNAPVEMFAKEAAGEASALAEELGLPAEALRFARLHALHARTRREEFFSRLNQVRLGLKSGSASGRQEALSQVSEVLVPLVAAGLVGTEEALSAAWVLDLYGEHEQANAILAPVFSDQRAEQVALSGLVSAAHWLPEEVVFEVRAEALPEWLIRRLELASRGLEPERQQLVGALLQLAASPQATTAALQALLHSLGTGKEQRQARVGLLYLAGNRALNAGRVAEALRCFAELFQLNDQDADAAHFRALEKMAATHGDAVRDWVLALRESRLLVWAQVGELVAGVTVLVGPEGGPMPATLSERLPPPPRLKGCDPEHGRAVLARFLDDHPEWPLRSAAGYYGASLLPAPQRIPALREFLHRHPDSLHWDEARRMMVDDLEDRGNYWLAARWLEELLEVRPQARVTLLQEIASLYGSRLDEASVAVAWARRAATQAQGTALWPGAQWALVGTLGEAKRWPEQAEAAAALIDEAKDSVWVRGGEALLARAEALEQAKDWEQAEDAYLEFIEIFPNHEQLEDGSLLVGIIPRLSLSGLRGLYQTQPEMVRVALPDLDRSHRERVLRLIPELADSAGSR